MGGVGRSRITVSTRVMTGAAVEPQDSRLARYAGPLPLALLAGQRLIVYSREPRSSHAAHVRNQFQAEDVRPAEVLNVRKSRAHWAL